jgi:putative oxidoreductase
MTPKFSIAAGYDRLACMLNHIQPVFLLLLRLYIGWQAAVSGYGHLTHIDDTVNFFKELNVPMPLVNVYISGLTELIGGVLLGLGVASRLVAIPFSINFVVAILAPDLHYPKYREMLTHFWVSQDFILQDTAFPFLFVGLMVLIFGPGIVSVDHLLLRPLFGRSSSNSTLPQNEGH